MKSEKKQQFSLSPNDHPSEVSAFLEPVPLEEERTEAIVQEVEASLRLQLRKQLSQPREAKPPARRSPFWYWMWGGGFSVACAGLLLLLWPSSMAPLQVRDLSVQHVPGAGHTKFSSFQAPAERAGSLQSVGKWKLSASAQTRMLLHRKDASHVSLKLQKGRTDIHVIPGKMRAFVVECEDYRVVVKGTIFSVERGPTWMRVEVQRGKVQVQGAGEAVLLEKGQGVRVSLEKETKKSAFRYRLPPSALKGTKERLLWLKQHDPKQLFWFLWDLSENERLSPKLRIKLLLQRIDDLQSEQKKYMFLLKLYRSSLPFGKDHRANTLFEAANSCRKWRGFHAGCMRLFQEYLKRYPDGAFVLPARSWLRMSPVHPKDSLP
ncbi:MAG: FecR domain-containing protein [Myxococcales bacterium]|nr:FecR domain-containing protein [Myxococcales bacterium]